MRNVDFLYYSLFLKKKERGGGKNVLDFAYLRQTGMKKLSCFKKKSMFQKKATTVSSTNVNQSNKLVLTDSLKGT